jgi:hypothetical protein
MGPPRLTLFICRRNHALQMEPRYVPHTKGVTPTKASVARMSAAISGAMLELSRISLRSSGLLAFS